ncbi:MAG: HEPN domain-containing protein [Bacillota bacterium]
MALIGVEYPKTHDLSLLLNEPQEHGQNVEYLYEFIEFNSYAVQYRYEAYDEIGPPLDRRNIALRIGKLLEMMNILLKSSSQS